jgi:hypothetical protein
MLHKLLYKNNKYKFYGIIIFEIIISIINFELIKSFISEDTGLSLVYLFGVLQFINIISYLIFRLIYKDEILLLKEDGIHIFITKKRAKNTILINKFSQIILFFLYQLIFSMVLIIVSQASIDEAKIIILNLISSILIFLTLTINDIATINKYRDNYFQGVAPIIFIISIMGLMYNPSYIFIIVGIASFILSAVVNFIIMMKGDCKVD